MNYNNNSPINVRKYYYIDSDKNRKGPVEAYKLPSFGVTRNSYVWTKGMKDWEQVFNVSDLKSVFTTNTPSLSSPEVSTRRESLPATNFDSYAVVSNIKRPKTFMDIIRPLLWAIGCFILAALIIWVIIWMFQWLDDGKNHSVSVKVGVIIAPIMLIWKGLKYLAEFFQQLF